MKAMVTDSAISVSSSPSGASWKWKRFAPSGSSTGSSQRWNGVGELPPSAAGHPIQPPISERMPRMISTMVIDHGDSCGACVSA